MKFSTSHAVIGAFAPLAAAFPAFMAEAVKDPAIRARASQLLEGRQIIGTADAATALFEPVPIFNAKAQYVDIGPGSGHEYVAPGPDDNRGPCPGLNAFANHGFLPHNGYATIAQFVQATNDVVGMGLDLGGFLSVYGAAIDGDGLAWSIGGTPTVAQAGVLGAQANGISGSHNKYEGDASPTRPDLYQEGNDYKTKADQAQQLLDISPGQVITLDSLTKFRSQRFDTQIKNNPYFFNGPFSGVAVQPAAYTFIYRFMANHSAAAPAGELSDDVFKTWFGLTTRSDGSLVANQGQEKIPANWYKRAVEYPYSILYFQQDLLNAALLYPKFLSVGGNTGKVDTFTGVDVANLTGGIFNLDTLAQGNNAACFAYQLAAQAKPDVVLAVVNPLTKALSSVVGSLGCPQLTAIDDSQLKQFPGYRQ